MSVTLHISGTIIIWSWLMVCMCRRIISSCVFFTFFPNFIFGVNSGAKESDFLGFSEFINKCQKEIFRRLSPCLTCVWFFILLQHCFYSYKPQIHTKQRGLTIQFITPQKNICSCIWKIKNKHDGCADVAYFVSTFITPSLAERLTVLLRSKDKSPGNEEA